MRRLSKTVLATLTATALLAQPVLAEPRCVAPAEQAMFELAALKSELLVLAIACHRHDSYNAFVQRYRPALLDLDKNLNAYFKRIHGAHWQKAADDFTTDMVNVRSTQAAHIGQDHCPHNMVMFSEVMALSGPSDLPAYTAGKDLLPAGITTCAPEPAARTSIRTARANTTHTSTTRASSARASTQAVRPAQ